MTQEERLTFLLDYLLRERQEKFDVPADPQGRRQLLRALMNVRKNVQRKAPDLAAME